MEPILRLTLQSGDEYLAHNSIVVLIKDHCASVVLQVSLQISISFEGCEMWHAELAWRLCLLDLIREE